MSAPLSGRSFSFRLRKRPLLPLAAADQRQLAQVQSIISSVQVSGTSAGRPRRRRYRAEPVKRRQFRVVSASQANHAAVYALSLQRSFSRNLSEVCDSSQNRSSHSGSASSNRSQFDVFCSGLAARLRQGKGELLVRLKRREWQHEFNPQSEWFIVQYDGHGE